MYKKVIRINAEISFICTMCVMWFESHFLWLIPKAFFYLYFFNSRLEHNYDKWCAEKKLYYHGSRLRCNGLIDNTIFSKETMSRRANNLTHTKTYIHVYAHRIYENVRAKHCFYVIATTYLLSPEGNFISQL